MSHPLLAIAGQLNYGFETPQNTMIIEDTEKIDACNKKLTEFQTQSVNCQKSNTLLQQSVDAKNKTILSQQQQILTGTIVLIFIFILCLAFFVKHRVDRRKNLSPIAS